MAFAVTDDHAAQEYALENLRPHQRDPRSIRDALTENEIPATDRRVTYATLKAYEGHKEVFARSWDEAMPRDLV